MLKKLSRKFALHYIGAFALLLAAGCDNEPTTNDGVIPQATQNIIQQQVSDQWDISTIRSKGNSGTTSSLGIIPTGSHAAFFDSSAQTQLYYGFKGPLATDIWTFNQIEVFGGTSEYLSMQVIGTDDIRISYFNGFNLKFARKPSGAGSFTTVIVDNANNAGRHSSYTTVGSTYAIAYQICFSNCDEPFEYLSRRLKVATSTNGTTWQLEEVEDIPTSQPLTGRGYGAKAFANETGNLSVVAYNAENHQLEIFDHSGAYNNFASWQKAVIETVGSLVQDTSVAIDSSGLTAIAYYDDVSKVLKVATRPGVGQPFVIQTAISGGNIGNDNSIAIRASDKAIGVSGYDNDLQGLRFALRDSAGVWQDSELVNVDNDSGRASSLVFTDDGIPNITHYQLVYGDLMLSRRKVAP